jgi:hypothetical protein
MLLPDDDECTEMMHDLLYDPGLSDWEAEFVESNQERTRFSDLQKEVCAKLKKKFY